MNRLVYGRNGKTGCDDDQRGEDLEFQA